MLVQNIAQIKAKLLEVGTICLRDDISSRSDFDNHHGEPWIFLKLSPSSRVRLIISPHSKFILFPQGDSFTIKDSIVDCVLIDNVCIETPIVHAPEQLFLGLYEYCKTKCLFCPITYKKSEVHYSLDSIFKDIRDSHHEYKSIGITTAIPPYLTEQDVVDELVFITSKIKKIVGHDIPIGISTKCPTYRQLLSLKDAGIVEARLNLEIPNKGLSHKYMPNKPYDEILESLQSAVEIFGKGRVSSNIIVGLGESDDDIVSHVAALAKGGVVATLYPYDPIDTTLPFSRPDSHRLYRLALKHKEILESYALDTSSLLTMCPACSASHIFPGKDL